MEGEGGMPSGSDAWVDLWVVQAGAANGVARPGAPALELGKCGLTVKSTTWIELDEGIH